MSKILIINAHHPYPFAEGTKEGGTKEGTRTHFT